jgi:hypothetical protein
MSLRALFEGLVINPEGQPVAVASIGGAAQYVVPDGGFNFHIDAENVDREVLRQLGEQIAANREAVTEGTLKIIGQDDLFTKAMIDASLNNLESNFTRLVEQGLPEETRTYLGMLGFHIVLNYHGEVVRIDQPGIAAADDEGE